MAKMHMIRRRSLFENMPDKVDPMVMDVDPRPLSIEDVKRKAYIKM